MMAILSKKEPIPIAAHISTTSTRPAHCQFQQTPLVHKHRQQAQNQLYTGSALINVEEISMRAAPDRFVLSENGTTTPSTTSYFSIQYPAIHQATITGLTDTDLNENVQTPAEGAKYLISDLAGSRFQIDLANLRASDFGISDIDFNSPNTNVSLYLLTSPDEGADVAYSDTIKLAPNSIVFTNDRTGGLVWQAPLSPLASQIITLPAGVTRVLGNTF
jgi:hypothetical protein